MSEPTLASEIAVVLQAPIVSLVGIGAVAGVAWKLVDWAYRLRIDALLERLALANDRLAKSAEDMEKLRRDLGEAKGKPVEAFVAPINYDAAIEKLRTIAAANTATAQVTKLTDPGPRWWTNPKL